MAGVSRLVGGPVGPWLAGRGRTGADVLGCEGLESMRGGVSHSRSGVLSSRCGA